MPQATKLMMLFLSSHLLKYITLPLAHCYLLMMMMMTLLLVVHKGSVVIHVLTVYKEENAIIRSWVR